ncbi:M16 family metallopeptidase [Rubrivirga sp. IMCC45206]|uniref:M16 family metallopeptidase n=1 Tax=Rubrivirga sp. IMCC45206 TaxID=3391614 RepID=UPI0039900074
MIRLLRLLPLALALLAVAPHAQTADMALPFDPAVRQGELANGLRYYVRANTEPEGRAELRLAVDAGSILEADDQRGLAHFVEHMAFNGTERFDEPELVRYLESVGTRFGPDLNAYTSFDETVYMLQVPTDSAQIFSTGLDVLREWAGSVTLDDQAIERERGVVLEEWRRGQGANERMNRIQFPIFYAGSQYAERLPIGLPEIIEGAPPEALRRYYRDWYRPDLMAVIVVGDVDADAVEAMIRDRFADLDTPADAPERTVFEVPFHDETRFALASDPEAPQTIVRVSFKRPVTRVRTAADARRSLVEDLFFSIFRSRLDEIRQEPGAPFALAFASNGSGLRTLGGASLLALVADDRVADAVEVLATEAERLRRFGVTEGELDRQKAETLRSAESAVAEADNQPSRNLAGAYVQSFLRDQPVLSPETDLALAQRLLPTITAEEVSAVANVLVSRENRVVAVNAPERDDLVLPTEADLAAVLAAVADADLDAYQDNTVEGPLVAEMPTPGTITDEDTDDELGTTTWTLSNGAHVILKPTTFKADEVWLQATSPGGSSLLDDDEVAIAGGAAGYVGQAGVGAFDQVALGKKLTGQIVQVRPTIGSDTEGFSGRAAPADLETLFQLVHLYVTAPRRDEAAFQASQAQTRGFLANQVTTPRVAFSDTLSQTLNGYHPRSRTLSQYLADLDRADLDQAFAFYQERFADVSDFTFVLVGAFEPEAVRPFVETYLASLPGGGRDEEAREVVMTPPPGVVEKTVRAGVEPQAQVAVVFHGTMDADDREDRVRVAAVADVLSKALREELREDRGGVYGVSVRPSIDQDNDQVQVQITFGTDPERVDELVAAVFEQVEAVRAGQAAPEHLAAFQEQQRRGMETSLQENRYWLSILAEAAKRDTDPQDAIDEPDLAAVLTMDDIAHTARLVLDPEQVVRVTLLPAASGE